MRKELLVLDPSLETDSEVQAAPSKSSPMTREYASEVNSAELPPMMNRRLSRLQALESILFSIGSHKKVWQHCHTKCV